MTDITWTEEQAAILNGGADHHTLILAGPGTGKSTVVIALANQLAKAGESGNVRLATFTRAATAELADKAINEKLHAQVTTVDSFALGLLRSNSQWNRLPLPLRIPDEWESKQLVYQDIRDRLAKVGWRGIRRLRVERLVREMAARWESLDEDLVLEVELDPSLRTAFLSLWQRQREVFGYSLFAEMPWYTLELVEDHPDADLSRLRILIVDEYQDLNACELALVKALASRGVIVVAVGDDEQSIYLWRMAAPEGIIRFSDDYPRAYVRTLTLSRRCGKTILQASQQLISTSPSRFLNRPILRPAEDLPNGEFAYLRYDNALDERRGVLALIEKHLKRGIEPHQIAVLVRSDFRSNWTRGIRELLDARDILVTDITATTEPLANETARKVLAICRLLIDERDDLAWWTLLKLRRYCSVEYIVAISDSTQQQGVRFYRRLETLNEDPVEGSTMSKNAARETISGTNKIIAELSDRVQELDPKSLLIEIGDLMGLDLERKFLDLVDAAVRQLEKDRLPITLANAISGLEPVAKELALATGGVALMTVSNSKGLTFDMTVTIGVEDEVFSSETPHEHEEIRRLLYVAMTRAKLTCYLTMATNRTGDATAYSFERTPVNSRSRSRFLGPARKRGLGG